MTSNFTVNMNEYLPLRDVVFKTLRQAILKGELKPGERLMEIALADKMGVSRTPVREALKKLEAEGLVINIPRRGAQVANITEKDLNDVLELRMNLENMAIDKACIRMQEEDFERLRQAMEHFFSIQENGDLTELAEADVMFHEIIYRASGNLRLLEMLNNLREVIYRYRIEYLKDEDTRLVLAKEHGEIYKAIRERDAKKAREITYFHLEKQRKGILKSIRKSEN